MLVGIAFIAGHLFCELSVWMWVMLVEGQFMPASVRILDSDTFFFSYLIEITFAVIGGILVASIFGAFSDGLAGHWARTVAAFALGGIGAIVRWIPYWLGDKSDGLTMVFACVWPPIVGGITAMRWPIRG